MIILNKAQVSSTCQQRMVQCYHTFKMNKYQPFQKAGCIQKRDMWTYIQSEYDEINIREARGAISDGRSAITLAMQISLTSGMAGQAWFAPSILS
jgi:hypothetical protein